MCVNVRIWIQRSVVLLIASIKQDDDLPRVRDAVSEQR